MSSQMGVQEFSDKVVRFVPYFLKWVEKNPDLKESCQDFDDWLRVFSDWMGNGAQD